MVPQDKRAQGNPHCPGYLSLPSVLLRQYSKPPVARQTHAWALSLQHPLDHSEYIIIQKNDCLLDYLNYRRVLGRSHF